MDKYQEALVELLENMDYKDYSTQTLNKCCEAINKLQELIDKATPKKPIERLFEQKKHFKICPNCWEKDIKTFVYGKYCDECGQRLE